MTEHTNNEDDLQNTFSVSELNRKVKSLLEIHFPLIWVEGEVSNISKPASGHWYFTLKDTGAQVSCAMFKRRNAAVPFKPNAGDHLKLRARVSLYEGRGDYQLIVEHMEQAGFGLLQKRYEELKAKLQSEGLFDDNKKKTLPKQVSHLAVVTSPTGAAIRDVLSVLERRFPALPITIIPSPVQGDDAPEQLVNALTKADKEKRFDTILLCRGGGSIEDLWSFNSEALARSIAKCNTPIVSAVGHEIDFTISDFVADLRAPTPSAAAELISGDSEELVQLYTRLQTQIQRAISRRIKHAADKLVFLRRQLKHPRDKLEQWHQRLDHIETRLTHALTRRIEGKSQRYALIEHRLSSANPITDIKRKQRDISDLTLKLNQQIRKLFDDKQLRFKHLVSQLDLVSPIATINRGYSIARDSENHVLHSIDKVNVGDEISVRISDGTLISTVKQKVPPLT